MKLKNMENMNWNFFVLFLAWGFSTWLNAQEAFEEPSQEEIDAYADAFLSSLDRQHGTINLPGGKATLAVPENYYYLSPEDSKRVLEDAWGNPPDEALNLGMLFPAEYSPLDDASWGVTIDYSDEGHVSDDDAKDIDYSELLSEMKASTREDSRSRVNAGYDSIELVNWASTPYYDANAHKLHWAQELKFGGSPEHILNYNVRVLGREGVLVMNFIANMSQLDEISASRDDVLAMAEFTDGNRYSQFDPSIDQVAAYGIGGLIAGKVALKTGLLAFLLILLKKFWFLILIPFALFKNFFTKKNTEPEA